MDKLIDISKIIESVRESLETRLAPRESIVVDFIGRDKELKQLSDWFLDPASRIWVLAGDGGEGKSALAYNFALEVRLNAHEPFEAVFWLSAKRRRFLEGTIITIDEPDFHDLDSVLSPLLFYYGWVDEIEQFIEKKHRVLELLSEVPAFIVVDDIDSLESENEDVSEFFSFHLSGTKSKVLFTSRRTLWYRTFPHWCGTLRAW